MILNQWTLITCKSVLIERTISGPEKLNFHVITITSEKLRRHQPINIHEQLACLVAKLVSRTSLPYVTAFCLVTNIRQKLIRAFV